MKVNFSRLTDKDKALLAEFFDSDHYVAFKKHFIDNAQIYIAQNALFGTEQNRFQAQGKVALLKEMHEHLKDINKKANQID